MKARAKRARGDLGVFPQERRSYEGSSLASPAVWGKLFRQLKSQTITSCHSKDAIVEAGFRQKYLATNFEVACALFIDGVVSMIIGTGAVEFYKVRKEQNVGQERARRCSIGVIQTYRYQKVHAS
jgi:hypothetical protein